MSSTKSILSFDVGIRHLAFCHLTHEAWQEATSKVLQWDVIDLGPVSSVEMCVSRLMTRLDKRFKDVCADVVLIERQPKSRSIIMVAVQMFLCSYFSMAKLRGAVGDVKFISAQRKLEMKRRPEEKPEEEKQALSQAQRYAANKKYAVEVTRHYLEHVLQDFGNLVLLDMYPKKDDLCDSFLQALAFIESQGRCSRPTYARRKPGDAPPSKPQKARRNRS